jgi:ribosomal protein L37AE/L43A
MKANDLDKYVCPKCKEKFRLRYNLRFHKCRRDVEDDREEKYRDEWRL